MLWLFPHRIVDRGVRRASTESVVRKVVRQNKFRPFPSNVGRRSEAETQLIGQVLSESNLTMSNAFSVFSAVRRRFRSSYRIYLFWSPLSKNSANGILPNPTPPIEPHIAPRVRFLLSL